jgi:hypothetical protein
MTDRRSYLHIGSTTRTVVVTTYATGSGSGVHFPKNKSDARVHGNTTGLGEVVLLRLGSVEGTTSLERQRLGPHPHPSPVRRQEVGLVALARHDRYRCRWCMRTEKCKNKSDARVHGNTTGLGEVVLLRLGSVEAAPASVSRPAPRSRSRRSRAPRSVSLPVVDVST